MAGAVLRGEDEVLTNGSTLEPLEIGALAPTTIFMGKV